MKCWNCGAEFDENLIIAIPDEYKGGPDKTPPCPSCIEAMEFEDFGHED